MTDSSAAISALVKVDLVDGILYINFFLTWFEDTMTLVIGS
jgi:hypothetical protein